jgi:dTMP kinase
MLHRKNLFITIEGTEGVGKSTAVATIANYLRENSVDLVTTREPGGTKIGERIRDVLLHDQSESLCDMTELLLMFAARVQHIEHIIKPALAQGHTVLCDRFTDASFAYQGYGRGVNINYIKQLQAMVQQDLRVDYTFLFDAPIEVAMSRIAGRSLDRIERAGVGFFNRVRDAYLNMAAQEPNRFIVIDASQEFAKVTADILHACRDRLAESV